MGGDRIGHPVAVARTADCTSASLFGCQLTDKDRAFLGVVKCESVDLRLRAHIDLEADELSGCDFRFKADTTSIVGKSFDIAVSDIEADGCLGTHFPMSPI